MIFRNFAKFSATQHGMARTVCQQLLSFL